MFNCFKDREIINELRQEMIKFRDNWAELNTYLGEI